MTDGARARSAATTRPGRRARLIAALASFLLVLLMGTVPALAQSGPAFTKAFQASTIAPGGVSTAVFTIDNSGGGSPVTDLAFTDTLPAGVTIADPADASTTCTSATLSAPAGGGAISLSDGSVGAGETCTVEVNVTAAAAGTYTNPSIALSSSAGPSNSTATDLVVTGTDRPAFAKAFSDASVPLGSPTMLTFSIDNTANTGTFSSGIDFTDNLPSGLQVASPSNLSNTCGGTASAPAGGSTVSLVSGVLFAGDTCEVTVQIATVAAGTQVNVTSELTSLPNGGAAVSSGKATDAVEVTSSTTAPNLTKAFTDDPVAPGGTVTLEFTIQNPDRNFAATDITFTDDLDATLSGLVAAGLPASNVCGSGSEISGTSLLTLTGGNLPAGGSCTFSVTLNVPTGLSAGDNGPHLNTTSAIEATIDGSPVTGNQASDNLVINALAPLIAKTFVPDTATPGDPVSIEFTITNQSSTDPVSSIAFSDVVSPPFPGLALSFSPSPPCGGGSIAFSTTVSGDQTIILNNGSLAAGASCTFSADFTLPDTPSGDYTNTTSEITAEVGGTPVTGGTATDTMTVDAGPRLSMSKSFTDDPVLPGSTATLEFTIINISDSDTVTDIAFTDNLSTMPRTSGGGSTTLGGSVLGVLPSSPCGAGSALSGATVLSLSGGELGPNESCTFAVSVQVPAAAEGDYENTTSNLEGATGGSPQTVALSAATDTLEVSSVLAPTITKDFTDDPVIPGDTATLEFTITNPNTGDAATNIAFTDSLNATLSGLVATGLPASNICGAGSQITGTSSLDFTGGNLAAGASCTFSVTLAVPVAAVSNGYPNTTSAITATVDGTPVTGDPAADVLTVEEAVLLFSKEFTDDPVPDGDTVTLAFTIENTSTSAVSAIGFTDDLDAVLSGLASTSGSVSACGGTISGTSSLSLTGGTLAAGASCNFSVTLQVPGGSTPGTYPNTTSMLTGSAGGLAATGDPASDSLVVTSATAVTFLKSFTDSPVGAGGTVTLEFTISNPGATTISGLSFTDDLDAVISGLVATGLPASNVCGTGSEISGTSLLAFSGGDLAPGTSCSFDVTLQVPAAASPGSFPNTTSDLAQSGLMVASPAAATLVIEPTPTFAKEFAPDSILVGETSVLTFTIDNTASSIAATALDFTDNLPPGLVVATPASASTTCSGGTFSASAGAGSVGYSGGSVGAGAPCTLSVNVTAATPGAYANTTGDLTSSSGNSGSAMDTLNVGGAPVGFSKAFSPDSVGLGVVSTLTFTIDNTGNAAPATALDFDDIFPGGLVVASPSNLSTTCSGGTLTATSGGNTIDYTGGSVGAGAFCTVEVDIANTTTGSFTNTSSELTSSLGSSGTATATLNVGGTPVGFSKAFAPGTIIVGGVSTLTFTIDNTANATPATLLDFTDNLPAELTLATPVNASTTCTGGTLTAAAGGSVISYAGGTAAASAACTVQADVTGTSVGSFANTSGDLTSSFGNSGSATATLVVNQDPNVIVEETMEVIRNFMNRRADLITVEEPDLTPLLDGPGLGPPLDASVYFDPNGSDFSFATSLSRLAYAATAGQREQQRQALAALGYLNGSNGPAVPRFDIWAQGSFTRYNDSSAGQSNEGYFGLLYFGAHYRVRPNLALGVLGQFDWTDEEDDSTGVGADGKGWLAGPYVVGRFGGNLYWQARGAWGTSDNNVTPFGTYTDDFQTTRWLASGKVEGRFYAGNWRFSPRAGLIYFEESQHSYVDSNGLTIPSQVVSLGRATFGPEVGYQMALPDGGYFEPSLGMSGIWDFDEDAKGLVGIVSGPEELRARVTGGFTFRSGDGLGFRASGFYDGIGDSEFEAYGGKLKLVVPIQ